MIDKKQIQKNVSDKLSIKNPMALPYIEKIVINIGIGKNKEDKKLTEDTIKNLSIISGQKPKITRARKAISGFKVREGEEVGAMVTLRGRKMTSFIEKFASIALPRIRDFKGLSKNHFDRQGNFTLPIKEQIIFPEIPYDKVQSIHGMQITFKILNSNPKKSLILLEEYGIPFTKEKKLRHSKDVESTESRS